MNNLIILMIALPIWGAIFWWWYTSHKAAKQDAANRSEIHTPKKPKITYEPEIIRPPPMARGACGIRGCPIPGRHSHIEDLARRLKGK